MSAALNSSCGPRSVSSSFARMNTQDTSEGGQEFMRAMSRCDRALLTQGKLIEVVDHHGNTIMKFPLALFNAASSRNDLVVYDKITVPEGHHIAQVKRLLSLLMKVPAAPYVGELPPTEDTYVDLQFHSAAEALGMGSFTQGIFDLYFKRVNNHIAKVPHIEAIGAVNTPPGNKIYKQMAYKIGAAYFENKIANRADFERYLQTNPRLSDAVNEVVTRKEIAVKREIQNEAGRIEFLDRQRKREEKAKDAEAEKVETELWRANREEQKKKEKTLVRTMLEKKRLGQKLNAEEARAHEKLFGKAVAPQ